MDGWESKRRRFGGHDWCVIRLGVPGDLVGLELDTTHFTGNFPPAASVWASKKRMIHGDASESWEEILDLSAWDHRNDTFLIANSLARGDG